MAARYENIVNFLKLHYCLSRREEPFWRDNADPASIPERLRDLLEQWRYRPPGRFDFILDLESFAFFNYQYILYGMEFRTDLTPVRDEFPNAARPSRSSQRIRQFGDRAAHDLPAHRALIEQISAAEPAWQPAGKRCPLPRSGSGARGISLQLGGAPRPRSRRARRSRAPCGRRPASNSGLAIIVVTIAISTSIENSAGPMMPFCRPILMMISSISPREFISAPMPSAVRLSSPASRAAAQQAPNLARIEAARMPSAISSSVGRVDHVQRVLRPE